MTSNRTDQIEGLCHAALARAPSDRAAFLAEVCGRDEALHKEVASLLLQEAAAEQFLNVPAVDVLRASSGRAVSPSAEAGDSEQPIL